MTISNLVTILFTFYEVGLSFVNIEGSLSSVFSLNDFMSGSCNK